MGNPNNIEINAVITVTTIEAEIQVGNFTLPVDLSNSISVSDSASIDLPKTESNQIAVTDALSSISVNLNPSDSFAVTDSPSLNLNKIDSDSASFTDSIDITRTINLSDSIAVTDSINVVKVLAQDFNNSIAVTDSDSLAINKPVISNDIAVTDALTALFEMTLSDSASLTDANITEIGIPKTDDTAITDASSNEITKIFSDAIALTDAISIDFPLVFSDSAAFTDSIDPVISPFELSDSIVVTDDFDGDNVHDAAHQFTKALNNTGLLSESVNRQTTSPSSADSAGISDIADMGPGNVLNNSLAASDSARIFHVDYVDGSYFVLSGEYVGTVTVV